MEHQVMDWGYVDWFINENQNSQTSNIMIGKTEVYPHKVQKLHQHYGNEQYLYVLEGSGHYLINGEIKPIFPGAFYYLPANSKHQTINNTDSPIKELVISIPAKIQEAEDDEADYLETDLIMAIKALKLSDLAEEGTPVSVFDEKQRLLIRNPLLPSCLSENGTEYCNCDINSGEKIDSMSEGKYKCNHGFIIYNIPIDINDKIIGWIRGGFPSENNSDDSLSDISRSTAAGIEDFLYQLAESIKEFIKFNTMRKSLSHFNLLLKEKEEDIIRISDQLKEEKQKSTSLKINHHFLFNILNYFASAALTGEREELYNGIVELSSMLRYSSQSENRVATVDDEIKYLKIYLRLQKRRYENKMITEFLLDKNCSECEIPFNILQPIVENAFAHGFMEFDETKHIRIKVYKIDMRLVIEVENNGNSPDMVSLNKINHNLRVKNGHGLSLINQKLSYYYGGDYDMKISVIDGYTNVKIEIPVKIK